jgi:hypothetical protein
MAAAVGQGVVSFAVDPSGSVLAFSAGCPDWPTRIADGGPFSARVDDGAELDLAALGELPGVPEPRCDPAGRAATGTIASCRQDAFVASAERQVLPHRRWLPDLRLRGLPWLRRVLHGSLSLTNVGAVEASLRFGC